MRADAAAAPSSPTALTAPLLLHARTEASPISGIGALPASKKFSGWRDHAVAILRGRANVRAMRPLDNAAMVSLPLLALPAEAEKTLAARLPSKEPLIDTNDDGEQKISQQSDAETAQPLTDHARRLTHFLAEVDGPHLYLNSIRSALHIRQQQPDFSRYLNDVLLGRWITEYLDALTHAAMDELSVTEAHVFEEMANWQFERIAHRLGYLDRRLLPVVGDGEFAERYVGQASVTTVGEKSPMSGASIGKRLR